MIAQDLALVELQSLVLTCRESRDAFRRAARVVTSPSLAAELMRFGDQRHDFAMAMQDVLQSLGLDGLNTAGGPSRLQKVREVEAENEDTLVTCEVLESRAADDYAAAEREDWPSAVREMIGTHLRAFRLGEKRLRWMRIQAALI